MKRVFKKLTKRLFLIIFVLLVLGLPLLYLTILNSKEAKAAWLASLTRLVFDLSKRELWRSGYDDNWAYRKAITVTVYV